MCRYFLFTYITTTTVPSFPEIQEQFNISYSQVNWTVAIPALGLAVGPLFWSSFADIYGRRIIFIIGTTIALVASIGSAVASSYGGYMAARFFQGFGVSPAATVGMAVIGECVTQRRQSKPHTDFKVASSLTMNGVKSLVSGYWQSMRAFWSDLSVGSNSTVPKVGRY